MRPFGSRILDTPTRLTSFELLVRSWRERQRAVRREIRDAQANRKRLAVRLETAPGSIKLLSDLQTTTNTIKGLRDELLVMEKARQRLEKIQEATWQKQVVRREGMP